MDELHAEPDTGLVIPAEELDVGVLRIVQDHEHWVVTWHNTVARSAVGPGVTRLVGREFRDLLPEDVVEPLERACRDAQASPGRSVGTTYRYRDRRWRFSARARPQPDLANSGTVSSLTVTLCDLGPESADSDLPSITHNAVFESVDLGFAIAGQDRRLLWVNQGFSQLFGWSYDAVVNQSLPRLLAPWDRRRIVGHFDAALKDGGYRQPFTGHVATASGEPREVLMTASRLQLNDGRVFVVSTFTDVADRKRLENDLMRARQDAEAANLAKSHFLETVSHELRTPLNAILGFSEIMDQQMFGPIGDTHYMAYVRDIQRSGSYLLDLINDILDLSRVESGHVNLSIAPLDLKEIVGETIGLFAPTAGKKSIDISIDIAQALPTLYADERAVCQMLYNLLSNAIKFTHDGGTVRIECSEDTAAIRIAVVDSGIGIPEDEIANVMKPFERGRNHEVRTIQGTGLGLPLVANLAKAHGGRLELASTEGVGTTATLYLPSRQPFGNGGGDLVPGPANRPGE
ncbi:MAG: PAS domain-containing protein [Rhodospirillaceae bacterium]|nr:PAS domain-containing protein [Rhodospirillaceae bacterium]